MDKTVKFIKNYSPYTSGDIAGFDNSKANWLERTGVVEKVEEGEKNATDKRGKNKKLSTGNK